MRHTFKDIKISDSSSESEVDAIRKTLVITSDIPHRNLIAIAPEFIRNAPDWEIKYNPPQGTTADYWIVFSFGRPGDQMRCAPENTLYLAGEPPEKKIHPESFYRQFYRAYTCNPDDPHPRLETGPLCLNWHAGLSMGFYTYELGHDSILNLEVPKKQHRIAVVCSNQTATEGQRARLRFLDSLKAQLGETMVHFGKGFTPVDDKLDAILPYAYHLVLENCQTPDYWSEKIVDVLIGHAYPFYVGAPNLADYLPIDSFTALDPNQPELAAELITKAIQEDRWNLSRESCIEARERVLNEYNLFHHCLRLARKHHQPGVARRPYRIHSHKAFRSFPKNWLHRIEVGIKTSNSSS